MIFDADDLEFVHPDYEKNREMFEFLRISFEGEAEVKRNADLFLTIPTALRQGPKERDSLINGKRASQQAYEYVMRASYPEAASFAIDMATGKSWDHDPIIRGESVKPILNSIFADGSDFKDGVTRVLASYLKFGGGGIFVNLNRKGDAALTHYPINTVVNWHRDYAQTHLVVLEQFVSSGSKFDHAATTKRMVLGLDDETGDYFAEPWCQQEKRNQKGSVTGTDWVRDKERVTPTMGGKAMDMIPFVAIGGWEHKRPVFQPLVRLARSFFQASAELEHSAYFAAIPQPYIRFDESGGFWGVDEFAPEGISGEDESGGGSDVEILWGSSEPVILREGDIKFPNAPTGQLQFLENRCINIAENMAGLGLRSFRNSTNVAQTAETERMQQASEGAILRSAMDDVALAVTKAVRLAAKWRGISDADDFNFEYSPQLKFVDNNIKISDWLEMMNLGIVGRPHLRDALRKRGELPTDKTDEQLDHDISEDNNPFAGGFGDDTADPGPLPPLGVDIDDDDSSDEIDPPIAA